MKRFNANYVVLGVFLCVLLGAGIDFGRRLFPSKASASPAAAPRDALRDAYAPAFKVGDAAPEFTLPDGKKQRHTLAEFTKKDTFLFFACGCSHCKDLQSWMVDMAKEKPIPPVVTITTGAPEAEAAWLRDTGLAQTVLYAKDSPKVMEVYKGQPCPRVYLIHKGGKVAWISKSMSAVPGVQALGMEMATRLGRKQPVAMDKMGGAKAGGTQRRPVPLPELPPYAQPQSGLPGG